MLPSDLIKNILSDVKVELLDEFDKNFERKGFFNQKWARSKTDTGRGTLMMRSGALRRSISAKIQGQAITFNSNVLYATIHNEGGIIKVTPKMKRFFWAMYYKNGGRVKTLKSGKKSTSKSSMKAADIAEFYKAMALKKVGDTIKIPQRQFLGTHQTIEQSIREIIQENIFDYFNNLNLLKK